MIVITGAMIASGLIAGGGAGLNALSNHQKNRASLKQTNKQIARLEYDDITNWLSQMDARNKYVNSEIAAAEADIKNYNLTVDLNARARQRSIESGLTNLADISDTFIQRAFARNMKAAESTGRYLSTGQTGRTTKRMEGLGTKAVQGRGLAADAGSMEAAVGGYLFREKQAQLQQEYADKNAYNQVRLPTFAPPPVAPQARQRMQDFTGRDLAFDLAGAAFKGVQAGLGAAPQMPFGGGNTQFGTDSSLPTPSFGGDSAASLGFSPSIAARGSFYKNSPFDLTSLGINSF